LAATILVVDDEPYVRRSVERILTRAHYDVITASDVGEAVRYAQRIPVDAALVDFDLPDADGLQVLSRLREVQPACLRILMTAIEDYAMVVDAVNRGEVLRVLRKPYDAAGLLQTLQDAFQSARRMARYASAQRAAVAFQEHKMFGELLDNDMLRLAVQPIVDASTGRPVAHEALLRSLHPQLDGPLPVLRVAERHGRMPELGARVFSLSRGWVDQLAPGQMLFVNLAADQLADPARLEDDIAPLIPVSDRVTLEITEQSHLRAIGNWAESIDVLRRLGFALAVDDLGAGYNSLSILADLQPAFIKVDMGLVRDVHIDDHRRRVIEMVVQLADSTGARVVAEGVEVEQEAVVLREIGCHLLQGYHFGRPTFELLEDSDRGAQSAA
jgi:EAL domain-containing protein (putative c-di-GMP-specific phosphodiesterase class I)/CheY-like chemotaxis protein